MTYGWITSYYDKVFLEFVYKTLRLLFLDTKYVGTTMFCDPILR